MLKAVLFNFNGVIINDEWLHEKLLIEVLLEENLRITPEEIRQLPSALTDRLTLTDACNLRGRIFTAAALDGMIYRKGLAYEREINQIESLPIYDGIIESIQTLRNAGCKLAIVSSALRSEITLILDRSDLGNAFDFIVAADDVVASKPEPDGYLLGIKTMQDLFPELDLTLENFLAIEDSFPGIQAAKAARIAVVGVAHRYPFHMMQRTASWAVDSLADLEWSRLIPSLTEVIESEEEKELIAPVEQNIR